MFDAAGKACANPALLHHTPAELTCDLSNFFLLGKLNRLKCFLLFLEQLSDFICFSVAVRYMLPFEMFDIKREREACFAPLMHT